MLKWVHKIQDTNAPPDSDLGTVWMGEGGDGMVVIASKAHGYEVTAWWTGKQGRKQITSLPPPIFPSLEAAQQEADRLIFERNSDWNRLLED